MQVVFLLAGDDQLCPGLVPASLLTRLWVIYPQECNIKVEKKSPVQNRLLWFFAKRKKIQDYQNCGGVCSSNLELPCL